MDHRIFKNKVLSCNFLRLTDTVTDCIKHDRDDNGKANFQEGHAFIGYQKDTPAAVVFQASKQLKRFRKGLSMNRLTESVILGDIPTGELLKEAKGSDMWKHAVSHDVLILDIFNFHATYNFPWTGAEVEPVFAAPDCFR